MKRSKRYRAAAEKVEHGKLYGLRDAVNLYKEIATAKFNESMEIHVRLGVDPRHADQQVRSTVSLPHGTGVTGGREDQGGRGSGRGHRGR